MPFVSPHRFAAALAFSVPCLLLPLSVTQAQTPTPAAPPTPAEASDSSRTKNRGPETVELKFKLPPPVVLSPEQAVQALKLPKGFKAELVACEPMIEAPVAMSWDDQGRLYVCEMRGYMHDVEAKGEDQPIGRISRLEDTNGDGRMDKATVFADKLLMPRSVTAFGDGAIVAEPPQLVWYHDTDGDGVADKKDVIAENFGTKGGQPEHMANSLTYCMDNGLWGAGYGSRLRFQNGAFTTESVRSAGQWGLTQDDWGRRYFNYNSDFLRADLFQQSAYARNPNLTDKLALNYKVMQDQTVWPSHPTPGVNRGYTDKTLRPDGKLASCTATCGPVIYRGDLFPKEYYGNAFIPEPSGNLIKRAILSETGGVVSAKPAYTGSEFLTSTDERFRPVNAYNGPDGALYVLDMARGVIQHRFFLTHYLIANIKSRQLEQPLGLGRIYRIVPDKAERQTVKLPDKSADIVPLLDHANGHIRDMAQQVLVTRADASVVDAVKQLSTQAKTPQGKVQALWTLEGLQAITPDVIEPMLKDASAKVRATAVRLANPLQTPGLHAMGAEADQEVQAQLALQLAALPMPEAQKTVIAFLKTNKSLLFNDALVCGIRGKELEYLTDLLKEPAGKTDALTASGLPQLLANCIMNERRGARIAQLLDLTAQQSAGGQRQMAMLRGIAGIPADKKSKPVQRKLIYLDTQPASLAALGKQKNADSTKTLLASIDKAIAWPGKPGVPPPPVVVPLTAEQQARFDKGKTLFTAICAACHQPTGLGLEGLAPPLVDSEWVLGAADRPARIILHGMSGPIVVSGRTWKLEMPPLPVFSDDDIASILTYIRREWEHTASPVSEKDIAKIRETYKARTKPWTAAELQPAAKKKK